jgi:hypothetical protein
MMVTVQESDLPEAPDREWLEKKYARYIDFRVGPNLDCKNVESLIITELSWIDHLMTDPEGNADGVDLAEFEQELRTLSPRVLWDVEAGMVSAVTALALCGGEVIRGSNDGAFDYPSSSYESHILFHASRDVFRQIKAALPGLDLQICFEDAPLMRIASKHIRNFPELARRLIA